MDKINLRRLKKKVVGSVKKGTKKTLSGVNKAFAKVGVTKKRKSTKGPKKARKSAKRKKKFAGSKEAGFQTSIN